MKIAPKHVGETSPCLTTKALRQWTGGCCQASRLSSGTLERLEAALPQEHRHLRMSSSPSPSRLRDAKIGKVAHPNEGGRGIHSTGILACRGCGRAWGIDDSSLVERLGNGLRTYKAAIGDSG